MLLRPASSQAAGPASALSLYPRAGRASGAAVWVASGQGAFTASGVAKESPSVEATAVAGPAVEVPAMGWGSEAWATGLEEPLAGMDLEAG